MEHSTRSRHLLNVWAFALLLLFSCAGQAGAAAAAAPRTGPVEYWLTIFHNNDGESELLATGETGGAARFIAKLAEQRSLVPADATHGHLTLSSGDNFLAGPEFNAGLQHGIPFYDTTALDMIGYDALCLGNHDFDFGPDVLGDVITGFTTPATYLSANLDFTAEPYLQALVAGGRIAASTVVTIDGRQVGVVGATTEALRYISSPRNVVVNQVLPAVQAEVASLTDAGVDIIILISHLQTIQEDLALAPLLQDVDVMIAGGGDDLLASAGDLVIPGDESLIRGDYPLYAQDATGASLPIITTSGSYRYLGQLTAGFDADGALVAVDDALSLPHRIVGQSYPDGMAEDPAAVAAFVAPLTDDLNEMAGNVLAVSEVDLDGVRSHVRGQETNEGDLITDALLWHARELAAAFGVPAADVALQNGGGIRNNSVVPAGDVTELRTWDMVPFANFLCVVPGVPRAQFKEILENAVSRVEFGDGRFAQVAGLEMVWNSTGAAQVLDAAGNVVAPGERVRHVQLADGTPIVEDGEVVPGPALNVATIDFLANGGDQYPFRGAPFTRLGLTYQQSLQGYLTGALGGLITAARYPAGGEGRILRDDSVPIEDGHEPDDGDVTAPVLALGQNYPNPFNPSTTIAFSLERPGRVHLAVYGLDGALVRTLADGSLGAGPHRLVWEGRDDAGLPAAAGAYVYRLQVDEKVQTRTMSLVK
jgi:5'-nucleotidase